MNAQTLDPSTLVLRQTFSHSPRRYLAVGILAFAALCLAPPASAGDDFGSSAFGEQLQLQLVTLLGAHVQVTSGPIPSLQGSGPDAYNEQKTLASAQVSVGALGRVLHTDILQAKVTSTLPESPDVSGQATVNNLSISIGTLVPLLSLNSTLVRSNATIGGTCGSDLSATGTTTLAGAALGGALANLNLVATPAPNLVVLNLLGVRVVLNEQLVDRDGENSLSLTVNAIHISLANSVVSALGLVTGDIVIAHSEAHLTCDDPPDQQQLAGL